MKATLLLLASGPENVVCDCPLLQWPDHVLGLGKQIDLAA